MFARNLVLATIFSPRSLSATLVPLLAMTLVAGFWIWRDPRIEETIPGTLTLTSPISLTKVIWFGVVFVSVQIVGTLLTKYFGSYGMFATGVFGGLVSSASTTAAAATMAMHGKISAALAGSATVLTSLSSAAVNLPIVWRTTRNKAVMRRLTLQMVTVIGTGIAAVTVDRVFQFSELLVRK
jgi:uncharacterized membrane protein (DUF4010 family)